jgi:ATPase subunit of ABC transporter with duplicated ATPase domains
MSALLEIRDLVTAYGKIEALKGVSLEVQQGSITCLLGPNGAGKTTLLRTLIGDLAPDRGTVKWAERAAIGYYPQDQTSDFDSDLSLLEWMAQWKRPEHDEQIVRATLGRLLFSGDETAKSVRVLSGGERGRMLFGKLMLQEPNVLVMDEPTNHMDMESIESLQLALEKYAGTLIVVSHDRQFVSALATEVIELGGAAGPVHFDGPYEDYLGARGLA